MEPDPDILTYCHAPEGTDCVIWYEDDSGEMAPCEEPADVLFVFDQHLGPGEVSPSNATACADHAPVDVADLERDAA